MKTSLCFINIVELVSNCFNIKCIIFLLLYLAGYNVHCARLYIGLFFLKGGVRSINKNCVYFTLLFQTGKSRVIFLYLLFVYMQRSQFLLYFVYFGNYSTKSFNVSKVYIIKPGMRSCYIITR